ncbi:MATE family efflux transporter [Flavonifractor hominis]|uniref:Probable multidrug resistance protein NorM n=1 Tax=Flavonifractor hominis TaxID=3133178 RepID=A0ABV1ENK8_9FIRM
MQQQRDLTTGSVLSTLLRFAAPVFAALFLQSLYGGVDLLVVGQFAHTTDVSGVSTGSLLMQTVTMVVTGLTMGITIYVGQKIGQHQREAAGRAIGTGIALFTLFGLLLLAILAGCAGPLARLLHAPAEAYAQTCAYIRICGLGILFVVWYNLLGAVFRGLGDSRTPLLTVCIACVCNIAGDLLFVAGLGMGAGGAALATVLSQAISVAISLALIARRTLPFPFHASYLRPDPVCLVKELRLGAPIALQELLVGVSFLIIQAVVNTIDVTASAGVGVAEKVCGFIMLFPSSFTQSISAFVAQNMGANQPRRARAALVCGIGTALCVAVVVSSFTFLRGDLLAGLFSNDADVIRQAHAYLKAYAIDTLLTSILFCCVGYFNGCGHTFFVMVQGIVGAVLIRIPAVYVLSRLFPADLFRIGLATPMATTVQILLCLLFLTTLARKRTNASLR